VKLSVLLNIITHPQLLDPRKLLVRIGISSDVEVPALGDVFLPLLSADLDLDVLVSIENAIARRSFTRLLLFAPTAEVVLLEAGLVLII
jgi:hypothetical protein